MMCSGLWWKYIRYICYQPRIWYGYTHLIGIRLHAARLMSSVASFSSQVWCKTHLSKRDERSCYMCRFRQWLNLKGSLCIDYWCLDEFLCPATSRNILGTRGSGVHTKGASQILSRPLLHDSTTTEAEQEGPSNPKWATIVHHKLLPE